MDRLVRPFVACGLGLFLVSSGCRATRPEVPPGRPFAKDGQQRKAIEFSSDGHPLNGAATANFSAGIPGGSNLGAGIGSSGGRPDGSSLGGPPGAYGPPGTSGMAEPGSSDPAASRASSPPAEMPPAGMPPLETPPGPGPGSSNVPDLKASPAREDSPAPSPNIPPSVDKPGAMGIPDQMPSPM